MLVIIKRAGRGRGREEVAVAAGVVHCRGGGAVRWARVVFVAGARGFCGQTGCSVGGAHGLGFAFRFFRPVSSFSAGCPRPKRARQLGVGAAESDTAKGPPHPAKMLFSPMVGRLTQAGYVHQNIRYSYIECCRVAEKPQDDDTIRSNAVYSSTAK